MKKGISKEVNPRDMNKKELDKFREEKLRERQQKINSDETINK